MPRFLALDGDAARIQLVSANVKGSAVRLEKAVAWDEGQPVTAANAEAVGRALREQLKAAGISPAPLLVSVGRDRLVFKEIKVPAVPAHEEPAIVRFQALKELTDADDLLIDFTDAPPAKTAGERRVQVVAIRKDLLAAYRKLADAAGLKLAAVTPRPFATLAALQRAVAAGQVPAPPAGGAVALLVRGDRWGEFTVAKDGVLYQARTLAGPVLTNDAALIGDIRRNLAIHANQAPDAAVKAVYIAEPDTPGGLRDRLEAALELPVHAFEPLVGVAAPDGPQGAAAGLAGLAALRGAVKALPVNFIEPRQPKPPRDPGKRLLVLAGTVAAAALLLLGGFAYLQTSRKSTTVRSRQVIRDRKVAQVKTFEPDRKKIDAVDAWLAADVNYLDELYDLTARMPDVERLRITNISTAPIEDRTGKKKQVASIQVTGVGTEDHVPLNNLLTALKAEASYLVPGFRTKPNTGAEKDRFKKEFVLKFEAEKRPPDKYTRTFEAKAPPRPSRRGPGMDFGNFGGLGDFGGLQP